MDKIDIEKIKRTKQMNNDLKWSNYDFSKICPELYADLMEYKTKK